MTEIRVPALGESVTEATVGRWFKQQGEAVKVAVSTGDVGAEEASRGSGNDLVNHMPKQIIADNKRDSFALAA